MNELIREAIEIGLASFQSDPADNQYQEGYRDALLELQRMLNDA